MLIFLIHILRFWDILSVSKNYKDTGQFNLMMKLFGNQDGFGYLLLVFAFIVATIRIIVILINSEVSWMLLRLIVFLCGAYALTFVCASFARHIIISIIVTVVVFAIVVAIESEMPGYYKDDLKTYFQNFVEMLNGSNDYKPANHTDLALKWARNSNNQTSSVKIENTVEKDPMESWSTEGINYLHKIKGNIESSESKINYYTEYIKTCSKRANDLIKRNEKKDGFGNTSDYYLDEIKKTRYKIKDEEEKIKRSEEIISGLHKYYEHSE